MFGSERRQQERWFAQGVHVTAIHKKMRNEVPAAAYLFARTLKNACPLVLDRTIPLDQRIARVEQEMRSSISLKNAHAGIPLIAHRFMVTLLEAQRRIDVGSFALSGAFGEIAQFGAQYRDLHEADHLPPKTHDARRALAKGGYRCLGELINTVRDEYAVLRANPSTATGADSVAENETVWTLLAAYDLRDEVLSGRLAPHLRAIEAAVADMDVSR
jgi:hypothetical protein